MTVKNSSNEPKNKLKSGSGRNVNSVTSVHCKQAGLKVARSVICVTAQVLIAGALCVSLAFAFRNGFTDLSVTSQHIILCVIGYHFLMAEAILCLSPRSWLSSLSLKHQRRVHWILQTFGSILAIVGSIIKSIDKNNKNGYNWNTLHGQFGLVSMVFTTICLVIGVTSLYAYELRQIVPIGVSKLTHIGSGIVAFSAASITLIYGFDKNSFREWAGQYIEIAIALSGLMALLIIFNPLVSFYTKIDNMKKK